MDWTFLAQAHGGGGDGIWYPTILGVLVAVSAVVLFCGSIYLLLATDLGARLGFLVAFAGLMGFMVVLSALWITTGSPLNTLKGRIPEWKIIEVVPTLDEAQTEAARTIETEGHEVDATEAANVKAATDAGLVTQEELPSEPLPENANEFAQFSEVTEYLTGTTYEVGGSNPNLFDWEFTHSAHYAVQEYCAVLPVDVPFGVPPPEPECDPNGETGFVVLERDLGSLRFPPFVAFFMSIVLFGLSLLCLHWRERDEAEAAAAKTGA